MESNSSFNKSLRSASADRARPTTNKSWAVSTITRAMFWTRDTLQGKNQTSDSFFFKFYSVLNSWLAIIDVRRRKLSFLFQHYNHVLMSVTWLGSSNVLYCYFTRYILIFEFPVYSPFKFCCYNHYKHSLSVRCVIKIYFKGRKAKLYRVSLNCLKPFKQ